jgi:hypothetical protein
MRFSWNRIMSLEISQHRQIYSPRHNRPELLDPTHNPLPRIFARLRAPGAGAIPATAIVAARSDHSRPPPSPAGDHTMARMRLVVLNMAGRFWEWEVVVREPEVRPVHSASGGLP